jgi:DNA polymerase
MTVLFLDIETFSPVPITHGTHRYAEEAEVLLVAWAWDKQTVEVWDTQDIPDWREALQEMADHADTIVIHNSAFDRTVLRHCGVVVPVEKVRDTMVQALAHSLPGSLGTLCDVLGVPSDKAKDKAGKKLIQLFTKPRPKNMKLRRADRDTHPTEWAEFIEYARLDVDAMRDVYGRMPSWNNSLSERQLWRIDQRVNDFGTAIDLELARSALRAFQRTSGTLAARAAALTNGEVTKLTQGARFIKYLEERHGFKTDDLTKKTVAGHLKSNTITPEVRELLEIRQQASATSPAKYKVLLDATSSDGRLRGTLQFCGASRTGRDAGRIFQPQNLPRPTMDADVIEAGIKAMKLDCEDLLFENVSELCASAVRGCLVAPEGRKLVVADLSNIEGRVLAWLAGEDWKVEAFSAFDRGVGHDLYVVAYAKAFGVEPEEVVENKKNGDGSMRQYGKTMELAGGYGGGVGAYRTMGGPAVEKMTDEAIQLLVSAWRKAHPNVTGMWYGVEAAAKAAIRKPDELAYYDTLQFDMKGDWLRIRLPSGRYLSYPNAHINWSRKLPDGTELTAPIGYDGMDQFTKQWRSMGTYGGKLVENIVQAVARDVFMRGMKYAEEAGYEVCIRVHDELITETPDTPDFNVAELSSIMATQPSWAVGLPLAAAGFECARYRKD